MRTMTIGWTTAAGGATPGMRLPVRTITEPPIPSRKMRFGLPTSSAPSGVTVAAFKPEAGDTHRRGGVAHHRVRRSTSVLERQVEMLERDVEPEHLGVEHAQRLEQELLTGLVPVAHHDPSSPGHE